MTLLFSVSQALGVMVIVVWDRGMGLPLETSKSIAIEGLMKLVGAV